MNSYSIAKIVLLCFMKCILLESCEISDAHKKSARIEFKQDLAPGSELYTAPFMGDKTQISSIQIASNEMTNDILLEYFDMNFKTLSLKKPYDLNKIKIDFLEILFTCTSTITHHTNTFLLYVTINDVNIYAPEFLNEPYEISLNETAHVGSKIFKFKVIDRDMPNKPNSHVSFKVLNGTCSNYFEFPLSTRGEISLIKKLDYDEIQECVLVIKAFDHGQPSKGTLTKLFIKVLDVDNKDPKFTRNVYNGILKHNSQPNTYVQIIPDEIKAADQDYGLNTPLVYSLTSNSGNYFDINSTNGQIKLLRSLPTDYKQEYDLIIESCQADDLTKCALAMVNVTILTVNDHSPKFSQEMYEFEIAENSPYQSVVGEVKALDLDDNQISYFMTYTDDNLFTIDVKSGLIRTNRKLNYESQDLHEIVVEAYDGIFSSKTNVSIKVLNIIDRMPIFEHSAYSFVVLPGESQIGEIKAKDEEQTGTLSYQLIFEDQNDTEIVCINAHGRLYFCQNETTKEKFNFVAVAIIQTNDTKQEFLKSRVSVSVKIDYDAKFASQSPSTLPFFDQTGFTTFMISLGVVLMVLFTSVIIMFWYKQSSNVHTKVPSVLNASSILSYRSTSSSLYKKNSARNGSNYPIITQWNARDLNKMFYDASLSPSEPTLVLNSKSVSSFSNNSKSTTPPSTTTHSTSNLLSSLTSTSTTLENSLSSGESIAVDYPIAELDGDESQHEPLSINYETNIEEVIIQEINNQSLCADSTPRTDSSELSHSIQVYDSSTPRFQSHTTNDSIPLYSKEHLYLRLITKNGSIAYV